MGLFDKIELPEVKNIIIVASGKGGVGKSTVSVNLAIALAKQGKKVGLVDADIYGPSIPKMFDVEDVKPEMVKIGEKEMIVPIESNGVKLVSIGFFVGKEQGLIWRGPKVAGAITQLFQDTHWGELDYLIIDFPPGTGDIQLTTIQKLKVNGAIVVTTPQEVAVNDCRKAVSMFLNPGLNIKLIGVVENMSWFTPAMHPEEKYYIFGKGGGETLSKEYKTKLIGQIPLVAELGEAAEHGKSVFTQENIIPIQEFERIAKEVMATAN